MVAGLVLGGFLGYYLNRYPFWSWLNNGQVFGLETPLVLELGIIHLSFGLTFRVNAGSVLGIALGILVYRRL
jgi:hypothetical protein